MTSWDLTGRVIGVWLYLYREMLFVCFVFKYLQMLLISGGIPET